MLAIQFLFYQCCFGSVVEDQYFRKLNKLFMSWIFLAVFSEFNRGISRFLALHLIKFWKILGEHKNCNKWWVFVFFFFFLQGGFGFVFFFFKYTCMENQLNELLHLNLNFMKFSNIVTLFEWCKLSAFFQKLGFSQVLCCAQMLAK